MMPVRNCLPRWKMAPHTASRQLLRKPQAECKVDLRDKNNRVRKRNQGGIKTTG